jgi:RND family efflux transporter MFP subunit
MILQNMRMLIVKIFNLVLTGFLFLSLTACSRPEPPPLPEVARPAKLFTVVGPNELMMRSFPGEVQASGESNLAFRVSGKLVEFPANRGIEVHQGDLLARLDHSDYQAVVNEAQAQYELAVAQYKRAAELADRKLIAQADYEKRLALMKVHKSDLTRATNNLDYTQLFAPFDGVVARRLSENFESVAAGQVVLVLHTKAMIDVIVDLPESIVARVERVRAERKTNPVQVRFGSASDRTYTAHYKEHETNADPATLTFKVTFSLPPPDDLNVLPGMSATVIADLSGLFPEASAATLVPIEAVFSAEEEPLDADRRQVWIVDPESMRTSRRDVKVGPLTGQNIAILEGLDAGELIVAAGVNAVQEGMWVRPMKRERGL